MASRGSVQRHAARADNGNVDELFDVLDLRQIAVFGHIHRRVRPVPRVIRAVVAVEHIIARILQKTSRRSRTRPCRGPPRHTPRRAARLPEALGLRDDGIAQRHWEIRAAGGLDGLDDLGGEAVAVFKTSAILIRALVDVVERKLVEQIALVHGMDLHAVDARVLQELRAFWRTSQ